MSELHAREASAFRPPRALDHLVLPVSSVERARERYERLGFTVAPTGVHPFGTENACVFIGDTFLEPLAVRRREDAEKAIAAGNTFVARDGAYRFRFDIEGFSFVVLRSEDAGADHASFEAAAMSAGAPVRFERTFALADGTQGNAEFLLAFAGDLRAPDAGFFACEVVTAPDVDRTPLRHHANGAVQVVEVVLSEPNPTDFQYFLQALLEQRRMDDHSFGIEFELRNGKLSVLTPAGLRHFCGLDAEGQGRGLLHRTFVVAVENLANVRALLERNGVETHPVGPRILVPWAPGQGTALLFEERA